MAGKAGKAASPPVFLPFLPFQPFVILSTFIRLHYNTNPMKRILSPLILISAFLLLPACNFTGTGAQGSSASSVAVSSEDIRETRNVTYRGTVEPLGVTITMQGTHALALGDGRMLILESEEIDLEAYVDHEVEVFGALRPTVEAGGIIMRVERITDLSPSSSSLAPRSSTSEVGSVSSSPGASSTPSVASSTQSTVSVASLVSSRDSSAASSVKSFVTSVASSVSTNTAELEARIVVMSKQDLDGRNWTQQYCTDHVGFCVPIHKNWWFVSFGNTAQTLWHVEVSSESFEGMGSGPIAIDLVGGDLSGHSDGDVAVSGEKAIGYRSWTQGRHFRISADARLEAAVRYMTEQLKATATAS